MSLKDTSSVDSLKECHSRGENSRDFCLKIILLNAIRQHGNFVLKNVTFFNKHFRENKRNELNVWRCFYDTAAARFSFT